MRRAFLAGLLLSALGSRLSAEARTAESRELKADSVLQVFLLTVGQGGHVWEKFGHNALWFYDPARGIDVAYNWGVFDFNQPKFLQRFLSGDTRYWVEPYPGQALVDWYRRSDRTITAQRLNLTPEQAQRAFLYAQWNAREENKYYRYDYFRDNCSTRVRDVIDYALGGALKRATDTTRTRLTYRAETLRLLDDLKATQLGVHIALGQPADRPLSTWQTMFIPMRMRDALRLVRLPGPAGRAVPLVMQERVLYESPRQRDRTNVPTLWLPYLIVGLVLTAEFLAVGAAGSRTRVADIVFRWEVAVWSLLVGLAGLVLVLAWLTTMHVFWFRNENLLFLNPLSLFLAVIVPLSIRRPRAARSASALALIIAGIGLVAVTLKAVPGFTQHNLALHLLFIPAHLAIAIGFWRRSRA